MSEIKLSETQAKAAMYTEMANMLQALARLIRVFAEDSVSRRRP